ncbi:hypothetical protein [Streptomyces sp. JW3]|uniref:hypothetical protein n=1 Tax=Streptomyces sp. JW3 TaxID=3456955 RepID=UPI003FA49C58
MARIRRNPRQQVWPWEESQGRRAAGHRGKRSGPVWLLSAGTVALSAGGYAWLGAVTAGPPGAVVGCLVGLTLSGLLHVLVHRMVSGRPPTRLSPPPRG